MDPELAGFAQDVVVDVGYVAHEHGAVPEVLQPPLDHVVGKVGGGMARDGLRRKALSRTCKSSLSRPARLPGSKATTSCRAVS